MFKLLQIPLIIMKLPWTSPIAGDKRVGDICIFNEKNVDSNYILPPNGQIQKYVNQGYYNPCPA